MEFLSNIMPIPLGNWLTWLRRKLLPAPMATIPPESEEEQAMQEDLPPQPTIEHMADVVVQWYRDSDPDEQDEFRECPFEKLGKFHHFLGRQIRNHFGLWRYPWEPDLDEEGVDCAAEHPDQISFEVIKLAWRRIQDPPAV